MKEEMSKIKKIVAEMTLEEKAGMCSGKDFWNLKSVERLGVPSVMVSDGPHGLRKQQTGDGDQLGVNRSIEAVCFPPACMAAASFDRSLIRELGGIIGDECQAEDISVSLGPSMNIKRTPVGGRNFEYYSEDPYLTAELATVYVQGVQGKGVGTSPKHYVANNQEFQRMTVSCEVDERTLREIYLSAFETVAKKARPWTVMCSYNRVNGEYVSQSHRLLTEILRDEWGFDGYVVSDWGAVSDRVAGLKAGLDLEMPPAGEYTTDRQIVEAAKSGELSEKVLDRAVERILEAVFRFDENRIETKFDKEAHHEFAVKIAQESAVLLKNDGGLLPLDKDERIAFIGEFAKKPRYQGGGSSHINAYKVVSAMVALGDRKNVTYVPGFSAESDGKNQKWFDEAVETAKGAKVAVVFAGLPDIDESEGYDREHMRLPAVQNELIEEICKVQKNVAVVLHNGSPVEMPWIENVQAILEMYLGGQGVGQATVDVLFGDVNPSGKLPETFPVRLEDSPTYLNTPGADGKIEYREGVFVGYRYYDTRRTEVLFEFGHGLSYTKFEYGELKLSAEEIDDVDELKVWVDVTNVGKRAGKEIVQLYVSDRTRRSPIRPIRELKGFEKISLEPGETKTVELVLDKRSFAYYDVEVKDWVCGSGEYEVAIGASSRDLRSVGVVNVKSSYKRKLIVTQDTRVEELLEHAETAGVIQKILAGISGETDDNSPKAMVNRKMRKAFLLGASLRVARSFFGFNQKELDAVVDYFNIKLGNDTDSGKLKVFWTLKGKLLGLLMRK